MQVIELNQTHDSYSQPFLSTIDPFNLSQLGLFRKIIHN